MKLIICLILIYSEIVYTIPRSKPKIPTIIKIMGILGTHGAKFKVNDFKNLQIPIPPHMQENIISASDLLKNFDEINPEETTNSIEELSNFLKKNKISNEHVCVQNELIDLEDMETEFDACFEELEGLQINFKFVVNEMVGGLMKLFNSSLGFPDDFKKPPPVPHPYIKLIEYLDTPCTVPELIKLNAQIIIKINSVKKCIEEV